MINYIDGEKQAELSEKKLYNFLDVHLSHIEVIEIKTDKIEISFSVPITGIYQPFCIYPNNEKTRSLLADKMKPKETFSTNEGMIFVDSLEYNYGLLTNNIYSIASVEMRVNLIKIHFLYADSWTYYAYFPNNEKTWELIKKLGYN